MSVEGEGEPSAVQLDGAVELGAADDRVLGEQLRSRPHEVDDVGGATRLFEPGLQRRPELVVLRSLLGGERVVGTDASPRGVVVPLLSAVSGSALRSRFPRTAAIGALAVLVTLPGGTVTSRPVRSSSNTMPSPTPGNASSMLIATVEPAGAAASAAGRRARTASDWPVSGRSDVGATIAANAVTTTAMPTTVRRTASSRSGRAATSSRWTARATENQSTAATPRLHVKR